MSSPQPPRFDGQRWSNADDDRIEVLPADPAWPQHFAAEAEAIRTALALPGLGIEHVGSTAVPGLDAKPIIDILLLPPPGHDPQRLVAPLEGLGYQFWRENPNTQRMFFVKGMPPFGHGRTHHVHVMPLAQADRYLLFRDFSASGCRVACCTACAPPCRWNWSRDMAICRYFLTPIL